MRFIKALLVPALVAVFQWGCGSIPIPPPEADSPNARTKEAYELSLKAQEAQKDGRTDEAIDLYQRSVSLQPNLRGVWNNLGVLLMSKNRLLDASEAFKREADLSPEDPRPLENLGLVYYSIGYSKEAMDYYFRSLDRDPNWVPALRGIALSSRRLVQADQRTADVLKRALLVETDLEWRKVFEQERLRVENQLREQLDAERTGTGPGIGGSVRPQQPVR